MTQKQKYVVFIVVMLALLVAWSVYVQWYASKSQITVIIQYNLDKLMHIFGGAVIATAMALVTGPRRFTSLIVAVFVVSLAWEIGELLFDPLTQEFQSKSTQLWLQDTVGDFFFAVIGALAATRFVKK